MTGVLVLLGLAVLLAIGLPVCVLVQRVWEVHQPVPVTAPVRPDRPEPGASRPPDDVRVTVTVVGQPQLPAPTKEKS